MKKVVIIGAGISGLAAGWYHKQKGHAVTVVERRSRVGGWIQSTCEKGFLFEYGPHGFRPTGKGRRTLSLIKELGLEKELIAADSCAHKRFIATNGRLRPFSLGLLLRQGIIGALIRDQCTPPTEADDETIADFCTRRFNSKITRGVVDPFVKGIFGGNIEKLSMRSCFPQVWEAEKRGAVTRNLKKEKKKLPSSLYSFYKGMETLPKQLAKRLDKDILLNTSIVRLEKGGVVLADRTLETDQIIVAIPAYALTDDHPFVYTSLTTVNLGWNKKLLPKPGFGFLVPSMEKTHILGMTWDSAIFPEQNRGDQTRVCVMIEGEGTLGSACEAVKTYLGIEQTPDAHVIGRAINAIPQYLLGHHKHLKHFQEQYDVEFIGNNYTGAGINDCIEAAWKSVSS